MNGGIQNRGGHVQLFQGSPRFEIADILVSPRAERVKTAANTIEAFRAKWKRRAYNDSGQKARW
jgi:hypothetical protein